MITIMMIKKMKKRKNKDDDDDDDDDDEESLVNNEMEIRVHSRIRWREDIFGGDEKTDVEIR